MENVCSGMSLMIQGMLLCHCATFGRRFGSP